MANKLIFITEEKFNRRDYNRFGCEYLINNGIEIEVWDCSPFLRKTYFKTYTPPDLYESTFVHSIFSLNELLKRLKGLDRKSLILYLLGDGYLQYLILCNIGKQDLIFGSMYLGAMPMPVKKSGIADLKNFFSIQKIINFLALKMARSFLKPRNYDFFIASGLESIKRDYIGSQTKILWAHAFDYDLYLREEMRKETVLPSGPMERYIIFLDEFLPFHPDFLGNSARYEFDTLEYYEKMDQIFRFVEKSFQLPVKIAVHPRVNIENYDQFYRGRECFYKKTIEAVKNAELVIAHASTAINFAVLYKKPICFVTFDKLELSNTGRLMRSFYKELPGSLYLNIDIDNVHNENGFLQWYLIRDEIIYQRYRNKFIKMDESENKLLHNILHNFILNYN